MGSTNGNIGVPSTLTKTMKRNIILLLATLTTSYHAFSQTVYSGEQRRIYNTILLIGQAWTESNLDTLNKYIDKDYFHTDVKGQALKRDAWFKEIIERKEKGIKYPGIEFEDIDIRVDGDLAFVTGLNTFAGDTIHKLRF